MRRVFRVDQSVQILTAILVCLILFMFLGDPSFTHPDSMVLAFFNGVLMVALGSMILTCIFTRVVATSDEISAYNLFNRKRFTLPYSSITRYGFGGVRWFLQVGDEKLRLPIIDFVQLHPVMVEKAPAALNAKLWRCGQLPPSEDFNDLWIFDSKDWLSAVGLWLGISGILCLAFRTDVPFWAIGGASIGRVVDLGGMFWRLSIDKDSISRRSPWKKESIPWSDVTAVFCEKRGRARVFVLTSRTCSILVPAHIARDLEPMRKLFYSLPDGTKCVNFDANFRRGYRIRRRKPANEVQLETAFEF